jgi:hypothetical protein
VAAASPAGSSSASYDGCLQSIAVASVYRMDEPKPHLARIFEAVAAVMELDRHGRQRLELIFADGRLVQWRAHPEWPRTPGDLARYDDGAAWRIERGHMAGARQKRS